MTALQGPPGGSDAARNGLILVAIAIAIGVIVMIAGGGSSDGSSGATTTSSTPTSTPITQASDSVPTTLPGTGVTLPIADLRVIVANGSTVKGLAGDTKEFLNGLGYANVEAMNAESTTSSVVYYTAGSEADAAAVATVLGLPPTPSPTALLPTPAPIKGTVGDAKVVVVLGGSPPALASVTPSTDGTAGGATDGSSTSVVVAGAEGTTSIPVGN